MHLLLFVDGTVTSQAHCTKTRLLIGPCSLCSEYERPISGMLVQPDPASENVRGKIKLTIRSGLQSSSILLAKANVVDLLWNYVTTKVSLMHMLYYYYKNI